MIELDAGGFKPAGKDAHGKDAQHANQLESSQGENPDPTSRILSLPANRGFASPWSASRPPTGCRRVKVMKVTDYAATGR